MYTFISSLFLHFQQVKRVLILHHSVVFIAEPILTLGSTDCVTWEDNWTTLTADGSPAAQFEHTILITKTGAEILTTY